MTKLPLRNVLLRNLGCLHPLLRVPSNSLQMTTAVVDNLAILQVDESTQTQLKDKVLQEWRNYQE